ncbi:MAG: hypothetical protein AAFQ42_08045 [Pseudomonadota bacterium]
MMPQFTPNVRAIVLLACAVIATSGSHAAAADDAWRFKIVAKIAQLQSRASCFSTPRANAYVHVLGVKPNSVAVTAPRQAKLVNTLSETILANTANRVTVAREFGTIATRSISTSAERIAEVQKLASEAERADITVVLQPLAQTDNRLDLQVTVWANDKGTDGTRRITCVTPFSTSVTFEEDADPQCARAWRQAELRDEEAGYRAFIDFFPDCAEAETARARITARRAAAVKEQKSAACSAAFAKARAAGSLDAYRTFVVEQFACPQVEGARAAMRVLQDLANRTAAVSTPGGGHSEGVAGAASPRPTAPLEVCARRANVGSYCVSSARAASADGVTFGPRMLFDGSDRTGWAEGVEGTGTGEWVVISFEQPTRIAGLFLKNGNAKSQRLFKRNGALRRVDIRLSNGATYRRDVANHTRYQWLRFTASEVDWVQLRIQSVRKGSRFADTMLNELRPILE